MIIACMFAVWSVYFQTSRRGAAPYTYVVNVWCCAKCCQNAVDIDLQSIALNWLFLSPQRRTEVCYCELSVGINRSLANHIDRRRRHTLVPACLGSTLAPGRCVYKTWLYVISLWWRHIPICSSNAFGIISECMICLSEEHRLDRYFYALIYKKLRNCASSYTIGCSAVGSQYYHWYYLAHVSTAVGEVTRL